MSTEENAPVETKEETVQEEVQAPDLSAQFVEIQKREKAIRADKNKMDQRLTDEKSKWVEELKNAPLEKLSEYGVKADTLATSFLNAGPVTEPTAEDLIKQELESLKSWKASQEQSYNDKVLSDFKNDVFSTVENDPDGEFELINNHKGGKDLFLETVTAYYQEHGEAPNYKDLAVAVESHLESEAKQLLGLKKFNKGEVSKEEVKNEPATEKKSAPVTISSGMTGRSAPKVTMVGDARKYTVGSDYARTQQQRKSDLADKLALALKDNN